MKKPLLFLICLCYILIVLFFLPTAAYGSNDVPTISPSVILIEESSGKILFAKNEHTRMYPASMTKIMTSLIAIEYLDPDDVVIVGPEISGMPPYYVTGAHAEGESITVRNLIRVLMIRSGNETGRIVALNVMRAIYNQFNIPYADAEELFCELMNQKARELGAYNTNFENPYGFHSEGHYTTAYDLALICREYMANEELRAIAGEWNYTGDSIEGREIAGARVREYSWDNHNLLLVPGEYYLAHATGIKTGFTDEAGHCLAASASRGGIDLIAIIFDSREPGRWLDAQELFEYGFTTFAFETIHTENAKLSTMQVANPRQGDDDMIEILSGEDAVAYLSREELRSLRPIIEYNELYLLEAEPGKLMAPIEEGAVLGTIIYVLEGEIVFEGTVKASRDVIERTYDSDMDFLIAEIRGSIFTMRAFPYWFGLAGLVIGFTGIWVGISARKRKIRSSRPIKGLDKWI